MSLARAALHARPPLAKTLIVQRRPASTSTNSHEEHHGEHHGSDDTQYANEGGFFTPFWRNTLLFSAVVVGFYNYAPARGEESVVTRYLAQFKTPREVWADLNTKHVMHVTTESEGFLLQSSATRPKAHRYRYPQRFDFVSPHLAPVGGDVDMSGVVAKGSHE